MDLASAWGLDRVVDYYKNGRNTPQKLYQSERHFILPQLRENISILDIGCAAGGFASTIQHVISNFEYTGLDVSDAMIKEAKKNHPQHQFHVIEEANFSPLKNKKFDLVICLGILHLHTAWRDTAISAWKHTKGSFIFDLREIPGPTIESMKESFFKMNFNGGNGIYESTILPYILLNANDALNFVFSNFADQAEKIEQFGSVSSPRESSQLPVSKVMMNTWSLTKRKSE